MPKVKAEFVETQIIVEGDGNFPIDMLRYDACIPATQQDVSAMIFSQNKRMVSLRRFSKDGSQGWCDRWASFGWLVVSDNGSRK